MGVGIIVWLEVAGDITGITYTINTEAGISSFARTITQRRRSTGIDWDH